MKITKDILNALNEIRETFGDYAELSRKSGVPKSTISRYVNGTTSSISDENWERLKDILIPYLDDYDIVPRQPAKKSERGLAKKDGTIRNTPELRECIKDSMLKNGIKGAVELNRMMGYDSYHTIERLLSGKLNWFPDVLSSVFNVLHISHDEAPISASERMMLIPGKMFDDGAILVRPIPVVDWANASDYVESLMCGSDRVAWKWDPETTETIPAPIGVRKGTVAFRVRGVSMEPKIVDGDKLFCEPVTGFDEVSNGKVVIARFSDDYDECSGCLVCKRVKRINGAICLLSDNFSGRSFDDVKTGDVVWLGVVIGKYSDDI